MAAKGNKEMTFANGGGLTVRPWAVEERQAEELKVGMAAEVRVSAAAAMEGDRSPHQSFSLSLLMFRLLNYFFFVRKCLENRGSKNKRNQKQLSVGF